MKVIHLDASGWRSPDDFYSALLPELDAPHWHGRNLSALWDTLGGGTGGLEPPFIIEVWQTDKLASDMTAYLAKVAKIFDDARQEMGEEVALYLR